MLRDRNKMKSAIFLFFVLVVATGYYFFAQQEAPSIRFSAENRTLAFYGSKNTAAAFSFDTLTAIELYDDAVPAYGTAVSGGEVYGGYLYGTWRNDQLGEYEAFVSTRMNTYVIVKDDEKTAIFNTSNEELTRNLYKQLYAFWQNEL